MTKCLETYSDDGRSHEGHKMTMTRTCEIT